MRDNDENDDFRYISVKDLHSKYNLKSMDRKLPKSSIDESFFNYNSNSTRDETDRSHKTKLKKSVSFNSLVKIINVESYKYLNKNESLKNFKKMENNSKKETKPQTKEYKEHKEQKCMSQCEIF